MFLPVEITSVPPIRKDALVLERFNMPSISVVCVAPPLNVIKGFEPSPSAYIAVTSLLS